MLVHACDPSLGEQGKLDSVAFKPVSLSELLISILVIYLISKNKMDRGGKHLM